MVVLSCGSLSYMKYLIYTLTMDGYSGFTYDYLKKRTKNNTYKFFYTSIYHNISLTTSDMARKFSVIINETLEIKKNTFFENDKVFSESWIYNINVKIGKLLCVHIRLIRPKLF